MTTIIDFTVRPTGKGQFEAMLPGGEVIPVTVAPLLKMAVHLVEKGLDPETEIRMWHENASFWAMKGKIGPLASLVVTNNQAGTPVFRKAPQP